MTADGIEAHREAVSAAYAALQRTPRESLRWVTTIIAAYVVRHTSEVGPAMRAAVDAYHQERRQVLRRSGRISRHASGQTRWAGAIELDLLHPRLVTKCSRSRAFLLDELGIDARALQGHERIVILHEHAVLDTRGHPSAEVMMRDLRAAWPGRRRLHAAALHATGTVRANLDRLASYSTKVQLRYGAAWDGRRTCYLSSYEPRWRQFVLELYGAIGTDRMLDANVKSQVKSKLAVRRMYADRLECAGEHSVNEPLQLCLSKRGERDNMKHANLHHHHEHDHEETIPMRADEIIDRYLAPTIDPAFRAELEDALARQGPLASPALIQAMYASDPEGDLDRAQQRLDLLKTRADIARLRATAARDRAETRRAAMAGVRPSQT